MWLDKRQVHLIDLVCRYSLAQIVAARLWLDGVRSWEEVRSHLAKDDATRPLLRADSICLIEGELREFAISGRIEDKTLLRLARKFNGLDHIQ